METRQRDEVNLIRPDDFFHKMDDYEGNWAIFVTQ